ncbi:hypothetical protein IWX48DRAFT_211703 [Phyllosticta citricarpa]
MCGSCGRLSVCMWLTASPGGLATSCDAKPQHTTPMALSAQLLPHVQSPSTSYKESNDNFISSAFNIVLLFFRFSTSPLACSLAVRCNEKRVPCKQSTVIVRVIRVMVVAVVVLREETEREREKKKKKKRLRIGTRKKRGKRNEELVSTASLSTRYRRNHTRSASLLACFALLRPIAHRLPVLCPCVE